MQTRKINKKKKTIHTKRRNFKSVKKVTFCNVIRNNNGGCLWLGGENDPSIFFGFNNQSYKQIHYYFQNHNLLRLSYN